MGKHQGDAADPQGAMLSKMKNAFSTYDSASKKYLSAVKELDTALEGLAIAFRELSQGDINDSARMQADRLCSAIDAHKSGGTVEGDYHFSTYMSDFSQKITQTLTDFKDAVKATEKTKGKRDEAVKKYQKNRAEVDETETKLAKKNQGVTENQKYSDKVAKRDAAKAVADAEEEAFNKQYDELMKRRAKSLVSIVENMSMLSAKYYEGLAMVMRSGCSSAA